MIANPLSGLDCSVVKLKMARSDVHNMVRTYPISF